MFILDIEEDSEFFGIIFAKSITTVKLDKYFFINNTKILFREQYVFPRFDNNREYNENFVI